ncbi:MAG: alpha/beta fold hydrolase [Pseudomonadales bacterium]
MSFNDTLFSPEDQLLSIAGPSGQLELLTRGGRASGKTLDDWLVLVCHPHPQHGGSMHNKVVTTVARAAREQGLDSLRFNYRGVGGSEGDYGEFEGEREDFRAVVDWVLKETGKNKFVLSGFSFGSAIVAAESAGIGQARHIILIAPPVERYPYGKKFNVPVSVIQGAEDEVVDANGVTDWVRQLESPYDYYYSSDTSHFFHGKLVELRYKLRSILALATS